MGTKAAAWLPALQSVALLGLRESYSRLFWFRRSSNCGIAASPLTGEGAGPQQMVCL